MKKLHFTTRYAFYLSVRNVERQIVSRFVTGVTFGIMDFA